MISNKEIAAQFKILAKVMEIHEENPFKIRSYQNVARTIEQMQTPLAEMPREEIGSIKGIGQAIHQKILDILDTGTLPLLEEYMDRTPEGVVEMLNLKGLGGKKIGIIWRKLGVTSIGELLYACQENRLANLKGFGEKTQQNVIAAIEFLQANQDKKLYAYAEAEAMALLEAIRQMPGVQRAELTNAMRRKNLVISRLDFVVATNDGTSAALQSMPALQWTHLDEKYGEADSPERMPVAIHFCHPAAIGITLFNTTTPKALIEKMKIHPENKEASEEDLFGNAGFPYIIPEMREEIHDTQYLRDTDPNALVNAEDIKGLVHAHTTYSDGANSLEEMANACQRAGFEYLVISDHSQSAFYANGLSAERVRQQHQDIDRLNRSLAPFKVFKSIESDILTDGRLDYDDQVLQTFDLVIASIHSQLKMDQEKATNRLIRAIEHPCTTILGHMTARLLLSREGYPVDHHKIIDACAANHVSIEINANPHRLDMDWRYIPYAQQQGVMISINPDAHAISGIADMKYGTFAARKGGLLKSNTLNALSKESFEKWISHQLA